MQKENKITNQKSRATSRKRLSRHIFWQSNDISENKQWIQEKKLNNKKQRKKKEKLIVIEIVIAFLKYNIECLTAPIREEAEFRKWVRKRSNIQRSLSENQQPNQMSTDQCFMNLAEQINQCFSTPSDVRKYYLSTLFQSFNRFTLYNDYDESIRKLLFTKPKLLLVILQHAINIQPHCDLWYKDHSEQDRKFVQQPSCEELTIALKKALDYYLTGKPSAFTMSNECATPEILDFLIEQLPKNNSIQSLCLKGVLLTEKNAKDLEWFLQANTIITQIDLSHCHLAVETIYRLIQTQSEKCPKKIFNFSEYNNLSSEAYELIAKMIADQKFKDIQLEVILFADSKQQLEFEQKIHLHTANIIYGLTQFKLSIIGDIIDQLYNHTEDYVNEPLDCSQHKQIELLTKQEHACIAVIVAQKRFYSNINLKVTLFNEPMVQQKFEQEINQFIVDFISQSICQFTHSNNNHVLDFRQWQTCFTTENFKDIIIIIAQKKFAGFNFKVILFDNLEAQHLFEKSINRLIVSYIRQSIEQINKPYEEHLLDLRHWITYLTAKVQEDIAIIVAKKQLSGFTLRVILFNNLTAQKSFEKQINLVKNYLNKNESLLKSQSINNCFESSSLSSNKKIACTI